MEKQNKKTLFETKIWMYSFIALFVLLVVNGMISQYTMWAPPLVQAEVIAGVSLCGIVTGCVVKDLLFINKNKIYLLLFSIQFIYGIYTLGVSLFNVNKFGVSYLFIDNHLTLESGILFSGVLCVYISILCITNLLKK